jgi:NADP-dependent 3-hydroxy acid dehydrogenase YdfG
MKPPPSPLAKQAPRSPSPHAELRNHVAYAATQTAINEWANSMRQLQAEDVANATLFCVSQPSHVNINEILMRPTDQER